MMPLLHTIKKKRKKKREMRAKYFFDEAYFAERKQISHW